jgi:hypothetical protein
MHTSSGACLINSTSSLHSRSDLVGTVTILQQALPARRSSKWQPEGRLEAIVASNARDSLRSPPAEALSKG